MAASSPKPLDARLTIADSHWSDARMRRTAGILFGVCTQLLFAVTVWHLFWFLKGAEPGEAPHYGSVVAAAIDAGLAVLFAVPHSLLLVPAMRKSIVACGVAAPLYGCFYCVVTCGALLITIFCWQPIDVVVWRWPAPFDRVAAFCFAASWVGLLASLHLTGLGWQTGLTPWLHWVRGSPAPRREFLERGAYRVLRHPVYLSFLGLIWFVPVVTVDRAVLVVVWSAYIFIGSVLKDRRLLYFLGDAYRDYQARVPGYPGMPLGPLARVK
jgi:protein-S-isoprenylcysteine O-methyltransferase Ste14